MQSLPVGSSVLQIREQIFQKICHNLMKNMLIFVGYNAVLYIGKYED